MLTPQQMHNRRRDSPSRGQLMSFPSVVAPQKVGWWPTHSSSSARKSVELSICQCRTFFGYRGAMGSCGYIVASDEQDVRASLVNKSCLKKPAQGMYTWVDIMRYDRHSTPNGMLAFVLHSRLKLDRDADYSTVHVHQCDRWQSSLSDSPWC